MNVIEEKMRQMRDWLKSVGVRAGQTMRGAVQNTSLWRRRLWPSRRAASEVTIGAADTAEPPSTAKSRWRAALDSWRIRHPRVEKGLRIAAVALAVFLALPYFFVLVYRFVDPPISALMLRNAVLGEEIRQDWADFDQISPHLARAAIISEDSRFCKHWGVDWFAVRDAIEELSDGEGLRGASTIPMQTAKNLFLWPEQNFLRKALEVPLAYFMSLVWSKQRILEVYLNIAEWGPGVYGAEAAARHHFRKRANALSRWQAALLVVSLPDPHRRRAGRPGPQTRRLAQRIQGRVRREAQDAACVFDR